MNQKLKYVGLLAILPLFTVALTAEYIGDAYAIKAKGEPGALTGPKSYGSSGKTCGQGSCAATIGGVKAPIDETKMVLDEGGPFVKLSQVSKASTDSEYLYKVTFDVFAGDKDVVNVFLLVESDTDKASTSVAGISAKASSTTTSLITAFDPETISVDLLRWEINS